MARSLAESARKDGLSPPTIVRSAASVAREPAVRRALVSWVRHSAGRRQDVERAIGALEVAERPDPVVALRLSRWLVARGHLGRAEALLRAAAGSRHPVAQVDDELREVEAEIRVLSGSWSPCTGTSTGDGTGGPITPVPGRVLHVVARSLPYVQAGYTIRTQAIAEAQVDERLEPHVLTRQGFPEAAADAPAPGTELVGRVRYHRQQLASEPAELDRRLALRTAHLAAVVHELRPAVLHAASDFNNALAALAVGRTAGIPVVYEVRGFWHDTWVSGQPDPAAAERSDRYRWTQAREIGAMRDATAVVTLAGVMKDEIVASGVPADKVHVIPNAVDVERFAPRPRDDALAARLGLHPGEVTVGYISSLSAYEGVEHLLDAIRLLRDERGLPVRGLVVGDGEHRPALEARAAKLGLGDVVRFTGRVPHDEITAYYSLLDVFVVPRRDDRVCRLVTPLKPYEAMAAGRAVVVSDVPALAEMVCDGETGRHFRAEDAASLASVLGPLVEDPEERRRLGDAARAWVTEHRTWRAVGRLYRSLYDELGAT